MSENAENFLECNDLKDRNIKEAEKKVENIVSTEEEYKETDSVKPIVQTVQSKAHTNDLHDKIVEKTDKSENIRNQETTESKSNENEEDNTQVNKEDVDKQYIQHITYEKDGSAIYTDPKTKFQYIWCTKTNKWVAKQVINNLYENEYYRWCNKTRKWLLKAQVTSNKQDQQQITTETEHYKWDAEKNAWLLKQNINQTDNIDNNTNKFKYDIDEDGQRICTDKDGTVFFWDTEKNAWFPKIDDHFMAIYQMNYGFNTTGTNDNKLKDPNESLNEKNIHVNISKHQNEGDLEFRIKTSTEDNSKTSDIVHKDEDKQTGSLKRKMPDPPKWFDLDPAHNTKVYVSNLPLDITIEEFTELMGKCGLIMRDPQTHKYKIKLYTEADGQIKGDGLCDYIKVESVELALNILDEYNLRGHKIRVQRAKFQMRGEYNPALKPKRKKTDKEKLAKIKEKLFDWRPEKLRGERSKHEKIVIIKNLFDPDIFEKDVQLILEYQNDLREECCKCGQVRKVIIYDRHQEGVAQINMGTAEEADVVVQMMHGRYFGKRQLTAEHWDGKTKYKIEETETEAQKRLNNWDEFLVSSEDNEEKVEKDKLKESKAEEEAFKILDVTDNFTVNVKEPDNVSHSNEELEIKNEINSTKES